MQCLQDGQKPIRAMYAQAAKGENNMAKKPEPIAEVVTVVTPEFGVIHVYCASNDSCADAMKRAAEFGIVRSHNRPMSFQVHPAPNYNIQEVADYIKDCGNA